MEEFNKLIYIFDFFFCKKYCSFGKNEKRTDLDIFLQVTFILVFRNVNMQLFI